MLKIAPAHPGTKRRVPGRFCLPRFTFRPLPITLFLVTLIWAAPTNGATTPDAKQTKKAQQTAQDSLKEARTRLDTDQRDLQKAGPEVADAAARVQQARYKAAQKLAPGLGVAAAIQAQTDAANAVTDLQKMLLDQLKQQKDYQATVQAAAEVSPKLLALEENTTLSDEDRAAQKAELSAISRRPGELRKQRVENNADLLAAQQAFTDARNRAAQLRAQLARAVEEDADVKAALDDWKQKQAALQKAQAAIVTDQQAVSSEQAALERDKKAAADARRRAKHS